jgi:transcriptional regulator with XRE-family HTH domain
MPSLKERRTALEWSRQTLAERARCSVGMVAALEHGLRPERSRVLPRIEGVLLAAERSEVPAVAAETSKTPDRGGSSYDSA